MYFLSSLLSPLSSRQGFTLIEVLIASSIFASIMLIAVASFTKMNQLNDRAREIRAVAEAGRFVMDDLERSVSNANGSDGSAPTTANPSGTPMLQSLAICSGPTPIPNTATSALTPSKLVTASSDASGVQTIHSYYLQPSTANSTLTDAITNQPAKQLAEVDNGAVPGSSLTANDVMVSGFKLTGVSAMKDATIQPYITIDMDITAVPLRPGLGPISQHFRTSIVSRDYTINNHGDGLTPTTGGLCGY